MIPWIKYAGAVQCQRSLRRSGKRKEEEFKQKISELETELKNSVERLTEEKENQELIFKHKLSELEKQVLKQRERTLELLAEKDAEINSLRTRSPSASPSGVGTAVFSYPRRYLDPQLMQPSEESERMADEESIEGTNAAVCQLITRQTGVRWMHICMSSSRPSLSPSLSLALQGRVVRHLYLLLTKRC